MDTEAWSQWNAASVAELPLTFVDVETTGLSASRGDRICEVAVVHCRGWREVERFVSLINPGRDISPGAARVNGITAAMVRHQPRFADVAAPVARLLHAGVTVAHNARFDLSFLRREISEAGIPLPTVPVLDTLAFARRHFSFPGNRLDQITDALGVAAGEHRALSDMLATRGVLERFIQLLEPQDRVLTLGDLLILQGRVAGWLQSDLSVPTPLPSELAELVQSGSRIRLRYRSVRGAITERVVDSIDVGIGDGAAYLIAYCHLRQERRTFKADGILHWERE